MKIIALNIILMISLTKGIFCQTSVVSPSGSIASPEAGCSLIDKSRDPLFITYERLDDPDSKRQGIDRNRVLVRLHNNSNCVVLIGSMEVEKFLKPLPPNPTFMDRMKRVTSHDEINFDLPDNVVVPAVRYCTQDGQHLKPPRPRWGGDLSYEFRLLGGNSMLFAVPTAYLRKGDDIVVPFNFAWEKKGDRPKAVYSGDAEHFVYFYGDTMPRAIQKAIGRL